MDKRMLAEDAVKFYRNFHGLLIHSPDTKDALQSSCGLIESCGVEYLIQCRTATPPNTKKPNTPPAAFKNVRHIPGPHTSLSISSSSAMIVINFEKYGQTDAEPFVTMPIGKIFSYHVCIKDIEVVVKTNADDAAIDLAHIRLIA